MTGPAARTFGVILCLILGFTPSPAANAAFSGRSVAVVAASTAKLSAPSTSAVSVQSECHKNGWYYLTVTASTTTALQYANSVEVVVRRQHSGEIVLKSDQASPATKHYATSFNPGGGTSALSYEIRGKYSVPNSTNYWLSAQPLRGTITCQQ